jgi:RimJ/RimL family protein N-acetyltransferase
VGFSPLGGDVEISYSIAEASRGHGYGAEAIAAACLWACSAFGLGRIVALTASANVASRRALVRAGFCQISEDRMPFQGHEQLVSTYAWTADTKALEERAP